MRYLCACRNQLFFDFSKYLRNYKEYLKSQGRFQVLLSTIFYTKSSMKPSWLGSSLTCNIFSKSWFLCSDKSHIQKSGDVTPCFFCTIKKQNFRSSQSHNSFTRYGLNYRYFWGNFQNTLFAEHISVSASWNCIIVSTFSFKIRLIQTFLNNILDSQ